MLILGDCLEMLPTLAENSIHCVVTSPPYFGLRDYGHDNQIGLEPTPEQYVAKLVEVFRHVWRVLKEDGTVWLNLGDSYNSSPSNQQGRGGTSSGLQRPKYLDGGMAGAGRQKRNIPGLKPKDLIGIPWRVAFALQADGWWLRSDIIWHKPNPMPESVTDRPTKAHEYVFLLTKSARYFYDSEAVREVGVCDDPREIQSGLERGRVFGYDSKEMKLRPPRKNDGQDTGGNGSKIKHHSGNSLTRADRTRNRRSVWTIPTAPYSGAHFATFPPALVEPCILAGCPVGGTVLDPFAGSGTVGAVARATGREFVGIELNSDYVRLAEQRIGAVQPPLIGAVQVPLIVGR